MLKSDIDTEGNRTGYRVCCARSFRSIPLYCVIVKKLFNDREKIEIGDFRPLYVFLGSLYPRIIFLILR